MDRVKSWLSRAKDWLAVAFSTPWAKTLAWVWLGLWGASGVWSTARSELVPTEIGDRLPNTWDLVMVPISVAVAQLPWLLAGLFAIAAISAVEYARRAQPAPLAAAFSVDPPILPRPGLRTDAPIKWAVDHLQNNGMSRGDSYGALRDAARRGTITILGRPQDAAYKPLEEIPREHWRAYGWDVLSIEMLEPGEAATKPDNEREHAVGDRYRDLRVNELEIQSRWPVVPPDQKQPRRELIDAARTFTAAALKQSNKEIDFRRALESSEVFMRLHPHLSKYFLESLRPGRVVIVRGSSGSTMPEVSIDFLKEIDRLEKEWGLR